MNSVGVAERAKTQFLLAPFWHLSPEESYVMANPQGPPPTHLPGFGGGGEPKPDPWDVTVL